MSPVLRLTHAALSGSGWAGYVNVKTTPRQRRGGF